MILFFDRSVGVGIPQILQDRRLRFPVQVEYHEAHFPIDEPDDQWLPIVGNWGWTFMGHDSSYHVKPAELSAIKQYSVGCFYLWDAESPRWEKLRCFARAYDDILEKETTTPKPFIYRISRTGRLTPVAL